MAEFPVPELDRLERLIADAFECTPGPRMERLAAIESQLARFTSRRAPPRRFPLWFLLIAAGAATAAGWWLAESSRGTLTEEKAVKELVEPARPETGSSVISSERPDPDSGAGPEPRDSPVIYSRETP